MENCSLNVSKMKNCYLCDIVMASEAQLEDHIHEQHSYIFITGFQALGKKKDNQFVKENTPSSDSKISQLNVKNSQLDVKSSLLDPGSSHFDFKSSLLDVQAADTNKKRDHQIKVSDMYTLVAHL